MPSCRLRGTRGEGFTLIELLVVLAIISTLLLLVTPHYFSRLDESREVVLRDNLRVVRGAIDSFYGDLGRYPDSLDELVEKRYLRAVPVDPVTDSNSTWQIVSPPRGAAGAVYDVVSGAPGVSRSGRRYADW